MKKQSKDDLSIIWGMLALCLGLSLGSIILVFGTPKYASENLMLDQIVETQKNLQETNELFLEFVRLYKVQSKAQQDELTDTTLRSLETQAQLNETTG